MLIPNSELYRAYNVVASVAMKTNVCCLLALGYFSLGIFKAVHYKLHFTSVN